MKKNIDVAAAFITEGNKFLLSQRKKEDTYGLLWEFPGGVVENNESPKAAVVREIKEELGVGIKAVSLIGKFFDEDDRLKINISLFKCSIIDGKPKAIDCHRFSFFNTKEVDSLDLAPADKKIFAEIRHIYE